LYLLAPALVIALLSSRPRTAQGGDVFNDDGDPVGTVAFFQDRASCPVGWAPATELEGRLLVGATAPEAVGQVVGRPLGDREDRTHTHTITGTVTLTPRNIAGANGGNTQGARSGEYMVTGNAAAAPSGLPFVQVRACAKR
jgi:hypothetical protein